MYEPIINLLKTNRFSLFSIEPYINHWCIPKCDRKNYLELRSKYLQDQLSKMISELRLIGSVTVNKIEMLKNNDNHLNLKRKRMIDSITGMISKKFYLIQELKNTTEPIKILDENLGDNFLIINKNKDLINFMMLMIEDVKRQYSLG